MSQRSRTTVWSDPKLLAEAAAGRTGLEFLRAMVAGDVPQPPIAPTLGFALIGVDEGVARFRGVPGEHLFNPMGVVHGGWAATLLDSAMGSSVMTIVDAETAYTTSQLGIYLTATIGADTGPLTAEGRVVNRGKRIVTAEGRLTDERGRLYAHGSTSCLLMPRRTPA